MEERLKEIRKHFGLTQNEFGLKIGLTPNTVTNYETGRRTPSNQVIFSICREFNVNESWLRTGEGSMLNDLSYEEQAAYMIGKILSGSDPSLVRAFQALSKLSKTFTAKDWEAIERLCDMVQGIDTKTE